MAKPRIRLTLVIDTVGHALTIRDAVRTRLQQHQLFSTDGPVEREVDEHGVVRVVADLRFETLADLRTFRDWVKDQAASSAAAAWILPGSSAGIHRCTHEEGDARTTCTIEEIWTKD